MKKRIYLAGPIAGLSYEQARHGWREQFRGKWNDGAHSLIADLYSPMRGKDFLEDEASISGSPSAYGHALGTDAGIVARDRNDVMACDLVVMNLSGAKKTSVGSMVELGWADAFRKPIVTIIDPFRGSSLETNPHWHPFVLGLSSYLAHDLDTAVELAATLLTPGI